MNIPIDYNKMQAELDKRHYMSQVYISNVETWKPTQLGLKTYGKWCDLVSWENLLNEKQTSSDDFMNLAIKRKWVERYYSFEEKRNVCSPTKFGHDLFKTFEYWIDEKAQKRVARKRQVNKIAKESGKFMAITLPQIISGITKFLGGIAPPKTKVTKKQKKKTKSKNQSFDINNPSWENWSKKENNEWWKL